MFKRLAFGLLKAYRNARLAWWKITGKTEDDHHASRVISGAAWNEFCETLKAAGAALVHGDAPRDGFSQAEGYRYLTRLTRAGLEAFVEYSDPAFPVLRRMVHETVKMGADNPDNYYQNAQITGDYEYRITGHRGTVHRLGFYTQNGNYGSTGGLAPCGALDASDMTLNPDGTFEIILSKEKRGQNWLKIAEETSLLMVRQTFGDRDKEQIATLHVETIGGPPAPPPLTAKKIDEGLNTASLFVAGAPMIFSRWANGFQKHSNKLPLFDPAISNAAGGDDRITYYHSHWRLEDDQALVITVDNPPSCDLWNFQLNNYWMESLDYRHFQIHVNKHTATYGPGGSITIIVSHQDPGMPNWIRTCEHNHGTMCFRWVDADQAIEPSTEVVAFSELSRFQNRFESHPA